MERVFYHLQRFVSDITGDILSRQGLRNASNNKHSRKRLADACQNTELFLEEKITKRERRATETLINNYLAKERAFYRLNERFVSNITGDIIFFDKVFGTLHTVNISQATCRRVPKHELFLEEKNN